MIFYLLPAALVFSIALQAFLEDESTPNNEFSSWVMVVVAALLWPVTLPAIINHLRNGFCESDKNTYPALQNLIALRDK